MIKWWKERVWANRRIRNKLLSAADATVLTAVGFGLYVGLKYVWNALGL